MESVYLDDSCLSQSVWFMDVGESYEGAISQDAYFSKVNALLNALIGKKKIDLMPKAATSKCSDGHYYVYGDLSDRGRIMAIYEYTDTVRDVCVHAHLMGHLMGKILYPRSTKEKMHYDDAMVLKNVLPIVIEKIALDYYGNEEMSKYYQNLRPYRFKKMCEVDSALRSIEGVINEDAILEMLDYNIHLTYKDVEDYCADVERGNDPVYKSYCYYVADDLANKMYERKNFRKDTKMLIKCTTVQALTDQLSKPQKLK